VLEVFPPSLSFFSESRVEVTLCLEFKKTIKTFFQTKT
jgi:hypothetical protein